MTYTSTLTLDEHPHPVVVTRHEEDSTFSNGKLTVACDTCGKYRNGEYPPRSQSVSTAFYIHNFGKEMRKTAKKLPK